MSLIRSGSAGVARATTPDPDVVIDPKGLEARDLPSLIDSWDFNSVRVQQQRRAPFNALRLLAQGDQTAARLDQVGTMLSLGDVLEPDTDRRRHAMTAGGTNNGVIEIKRGVTRILRVPNDGTYDVQFITRVEIGFRSGGRKPQPGRRRGVIARLLKADADGSFCAANVKFVSNSGGQQSPCFDPLAGCDFRSQNLSHGMLCEIKRVGLARLEVSTKAGFGIVKLTALAFGSILPVMPVNRIRASCRSVGKGVPG